MRRKPLILCVDDTSSVPEGRQTPLEENGYKILTVDLVLLDYHMPQMDGEVAAMHMRV